MPGRVWLDQSCNLSTCADPFLPCPCPGSLPPAGGCAISPACFANMTYMLQGVAPVMMLLEGGYNLDATAKWVGPGGDGGG